MMLPRRLFRSTLIILSLLAAAATAEGGDAAAASSSMADTTTPKDETAPPEEVAPVVEKVKDGFDVENENWGSYYDPQGVFCGKYDCYKILGFDYESFGKVKPSTREITKRYRQLSREWHPDKSKHKNAKDRFVKIARAYEVLTTHKDRTEYDFLRYNQEAYFRKYGTSVLWSYAPQTDATMVVLLLLIIGNIFSWYSQKHRWTMVADRLIKAAVEDWTPREGGTPESRTLREDALAILTAQEEKAAKEEETANGADSVAAAKNAKKKAAKKVPGRERKKIEQDALLPIVTNLVNAMSDFGGGFHKPTWQDLLIVTLAKLPYKFATGVVWQLGYWMRRLQKKDLTDEERAVLTERAIGITWRVASEEDRVDMMKRELWIQDNRVAWKEDMEFKLLSATEQKTYLKLKKKGKLDKVE